LDTKKAATETGDIAMSTWVDVLMRNLNNALLSFARKLKKPHFIPMQKAHARLTVLLLFLLIGASSIAPNARAASKIYTWYPPPGDHEGFAVYLGVEDSWQTDVPTTVDVKVTLIAKHWSFDHVDIKWTKVEISTPEFTMDSGNLPESASFRNTGEYYERKTVFQVPPDRLNRGENASLSVVWSINVDIVDNVEWKHTVYTGSNTDEPMKVEIYRPILSTIEWMLIAIAITSTVIGSIAVILHRRRKAPQQWHEL